MGDRDAREATLLAAAGQVLRPDDSRRRNQPFVSLRSDRLLHLRQRSLNINGPDEGPRDFSPQRRSALHDPIQTL